MSCFVAYLLEDAKPVEREFRDDFGVVLIVEGCCGLQQNLQVACRHSHLFGVRNRLPFVRESSSSSKNDLKASDAGVNGVGVEWR